MSTIHICFQPFFLNMLALHFIPAPVRRKISPYVYGASLVGAVIFMLRLYVFEWAGGCAIGWEPLCADRLCSVSGSWHIAWEVPSNGLSWTLLGYFAPVFFLPILYGAWRCTLYNILAGPLVAALLTNNINEWPAVWCLMLVGLLLLGYIAPVRRIFYVRHWWLWGDDLNRETDRVGALAGNG